METRQQGFTLIELIVVIVILGILSATALPKFFDLSKEARAGVMQGVGAAMRGADTMIYAKSAAAGTTASATSTVTVNGTSVATRYGYAQDATVLASVLTLNPSTDFDSSVAARIAHTKAPNYSTTPGNCAVAYTPAASAITLPAYVLTSTGC